MNLKLIASGGKKIIHLVKNNVQWSSPLNVAIKLDVSSRKRNFLNS
jgi:hypothetical protein